MLLDMAGVACLAAMGFVAIRKWPANPFYRRIIAFLLFALIGVIVWMRSNA